MTERLVVIGGGGGGGAVAFSARKIQRGRERGSV
ncbi:hypothetical protein ACFV3S_26850, partial [Streptomyces sp. NPDC059749]